MLKNTKFAGRKVATPFGMVEFDDEGITTDLTEDQELEFAKIEGYEIVEDTFQDQGEEEETEDEETVEEPEEELQEDPVEQEEVQEEVQEVGEEKVVYSKKQLDNLTVSEIEDIAKDMGIELEEGLKKDKINQIIESQ